MNYFVKFKVIELLTQLKMNPRGAKAPLEMLPESKYLCLKFDPKHLKCLGNKFKTKIIFKTN